MDPRIAVNPTGKVYARVCSSRALVPAQDSIHSYGDDGCAVHPKTRSIHGSILLRSLHGYLCCSVAQRNLTCLVGPNRCVGKPADRDLAEV